MILLATQATIGLLQPCFLFVYIYNHCISLVLYSISWSRMLHSSRILPPFLGKDCAPLWLWQRVHCHCVSPEAAYAPVNVRYIYELRSTHRSTHRKSSGIRVWVPYTSGFNLPLSCLISLYTRSYVRHVWGYHVSTMRLINVAVAALALHTFVCSRRALRLSCIHVATLAVNTLVYRDV